MSYDRNVLLSAGFEYDVYGWDVSNKELAVTLRGHKRPILKVQLLPSYEKRTDDMAAVSADEAGEASGLRWELWSSNTLVSMTNTACGALFCTHIIICTCPAGQGLGYLPFLWGPGYHPSSLPNFKCRYHQTAGVICTTWR